MRRRENVEDASGHSRAAGTLKPTHEGDGLRFSGLTVKCPARAGIEIEPKPSSSSLSERCRHQAHWPQISRKGRTSWAGWWSAP